MAQLETILELPSVVEAILKPVFSSIVPKDAFSTLTSLRTTSTTLNRLITDSVIVKLFSSNRKATLNEVFQHKKINQLIFKDNWDRFEDFIRLVTAYNGANNSMKLIKQHLFCAVKEASLEFVSSFLKIQIEGVAIQFPAKNVIKSLEYAIKNKKNDLALELLPHLKKCFYESDPEHFARVESALKNNEEINTEGDVFNLISRNLKSSIVLLQLLSDPNRKIIVPEGNLLKLNELANGELFDYSPLLNYDRSKARYYATGRRWLFDARRVKNIYTTGISIAYFNSKGHQKEIKIEETLEKEYTYEDITTSNIYELVVRTSLGTQFLRSFPHQFVAMTDQALKLPFEEQPWFFGNISPEEAKNTVMGSASNMFFLTVSYGAEVTVYWSEPKRQGQGDIITFQLDDPIELKNYVDKAMKLLNPVLGFYNGGSPKNVDVFKFHCLLANDPLHKAIEKASIFLQENNLNLSTIRNPSPLWTYLQLKYPKTYIVDWLIENNVYLHGDEKPSIMSLIIQHEGIDYGKRLLNLGVKCDTSAFVKLLEKTPSREEFKLFWDARIATIEYNTILSKLFSVADDYENQWKDAVGSGFGEKQKLIMLAWRFGNDDNLFKALPIEILQSIFQYDIDVPYWYSIAEMIISPKRGIRPKLASLESVLFVAKYRRLFKDADKAMEEYFDDKPTFSRKLPTILRQLKKIDRQQTRIYPKFTINSLGSDLIIQYCIRYPQTNMLREVMETKMLDPSGFFKPIALTGDYTESSKVPYPWHFCFERKKIIVELLSRNGLMPLQFVSQTGRTIHLKTWLQYQYIKEDIYALVEQCIAEGNQ